MTLASHLKGLLTLMVLAAALLAVLFLGSGHRIPDDDEHVRINRLHAFERLSSPTCDELANSVVALYIEGIDTGLRGTGCSDVANQRSSIPIDFRHVRNRALSDEQDRAAWNAILGRPLETLDQPRVLRYQLKRIGPDGKTESLEPQDATVDLVIFEWWAPAAAGLVLAVWLVLAYLGATSALVRDAAPAQTPLAQRTYSLAKVQMAWWFAIIFASFILLWMVTGETPALSGHALSLLGLSSVTTVAAGGVNGNRVSDDGRSGVFFRDLLSDSDGIAIHRFQMLVMTATLGIVFLIHVARHLTMPEFDPSLLTVMGISAATYVGMKIPEQARTNADTGVGMTTGDTLGKAKAAPDAKSPPSPGGIVGTPDPATGPIDPKAGYTAEDSPLRPIAPDRPVAHGNALS
jgi:hypothetical protein